MSLVGGMAHTAVGGSGIPCICLILCHSQIPLWINDLALAWKDDEGGEGEREVVVREEVGSKRQL